MTFNQAKQTITVKKSLLELLRQTRPSGDKQTYSFFADFLNRHIKGHKITRDIHNNFVVVVPYNNGSLPFHAFTSHFDTVHRDYKKNDVFIDNNGLLFTDQGKKGTPLGADDGAGIFAMLELINANIEGVYIFFSDEEIGGLGSMNFDLSILPCELKIMISLDRADYTDVICSQAGEQGASNEFGQWLADNLNAQNNSFAYAISHNGVFTDSANFHGAIKECVNLSVGYFRQHTKYETQDYPFLCSLIEALKQLDFRSAPIVGVKYPKLDYWAKNEFWDSIPVCSDNELLDYVRNNPEKVAAFLQAINADVFEIETSFNSTDFDF